MMISDLSVTRPVFASVLSLILIVFGIVAFERLPLREYPDIDPPIVSINTNYPGAAASIVETRITEVIEDRIAGVEGIEYVASQSEDGRSRISVEFTVGRDIEAAANDIRDRVSGVLDDLPEEADPPDIQKSDSSDDVILWLNLSSTKMDVLELTDYARRYLEDRFSVLPGVASVRIGGGLNYAIRVWLDREAMAARQLTVNDIEEALRAENIELPAGDIESRTVQFTARIERGYKTPEDFKSLVIAHGDGGYLVRLGDVARIERGAVEDRTMFRGNTVPMVGIGIIKQSKANTIAVVDAAKELAERLSPNLPEGMQIVNSYDSSVFIRASIHEVYLTMFITIALVIAVIYMFLGSFRATLVPAVTVPVSIIGTFLVLYAFGFSINLLTLLALVLAIGLVVDDAIVVLENIARRIEEGEHPLVASFYGTRQVGFAVVATTLVVIAVFIPITFVEGDLGRLFREFAVAMAASVFFSMMVALTLCPMLSSKLLRKIEHGGLSDKLDILFNTLKRRYSHSLTIALRFKAVIVIAFAALLGLSGLLIGIIPQEYAPQEDRGSFFINVTGPEGASFAFMKGYMDEIERRLMPYVESGDVSRILVRAPRSFGSSAKFNDGTVIVSLTDWGKRRPIHEITKEIDAKMSDLPGVVVRTRLRQGFGAGVGAPVQFVIGGGTYEELARWRDILMEKINENNPGLVRPDSDYKETKPQLRITIDRDRAGDLGVSVSNIGSTLETMLGSRRVTTYIENGEEYDLILEGEREDQRTPTDLNNIYVRSETSGRLVPLGNLVEIEEFADSSTLNRYNRIRSITIEANLEPHLTLGEALDYLEGLVKEHLPDSVSIDYKGQSLDYQTSGQSMLFVFLMGFLIVFLVLAAQFESYVHPFVIILTVPLAIAGALVGLYLTGGTLNVYTQIGLIMLVGLSAKNGILIVEFANQLRDEGMEFRQALVQACETRIRPILMTSITAIMGAVPLVLAHGAGAETRYAIGIIIVFGVAATTVFTLYVVPAAYDIMARRTGSPNDVRRALEEQTKGMDKT